MVKRMMLSAFLGAAIAACASAQQTSGQPADNIVVTGQHQESKIVCRFEQNTGTRFATRICHSNREWDQMREQQLRSAHELIDRAQVNGGRG